MQTLWWIGGLVVLGLLLIQWIGRHTSSRVQRDSATGATHIDFHLQIGRPGDPPPDAQHPGIHVQRNFQVTLSSLPAAQRPNDTAVAKAAEYARDGHDWDSICRWVSPDYNGMTPEKQRVYMDVLKGKVALRRMEAGGGSPVSGSSPPPA